MDRQFSFDRYHRPDHSAGDQLTLPQEETVSTWQMRPPAGSRSRNVQQTYTRLCWVGPPMPCMVPPWKRSAKAGRFGRRGPPTGRHGSPGAANRGAHLNRGRSCPISRRDTKHVWCRPHCARPWVSSACLNLGNLHEEAAHPHRHSPLYANCLLRRPNQRTPCTAWRSQDSCNSSRRLPARILC